MKLAALKHPSAFLPIAMSAAALAVVLFHVSVYGAAQEPDEGAAAHLWQLLMAGQVPVLAFFCLRWFPRDPKAARTVLGLQLGAALVALAPVWLLGL